MLTKLYLCTHCALIGNAPWKLDGACPKLATNTSEPQFSGTGRVVEISDTEEASGIGGQGELEIANGPCCGDVTFGGQCEETTSED